MNTMLWRRPRRLVVIGVVASSLVATFALQGLATTSVSGNIDPSAIQIDSTADGANLYPGGTSASCTLSTQNNWADTATVQDWVKDCAENTDTPSLTDSVAVGINPTGTTAFPQTGTSQSGKSYGHWNGVRVVDGVGNTETDLFITGGKENNPADWNIGPGSVGSPKYDVTQAYIANNSTDVFFGMERRGNNGTTAFDFEFNKLAPSGVNVNNVAVPNRSEGDVLATFEMSGSGSSGTATPHIYRWNNVSKHYDEDTTFTSAQVQTSINNVVVPSAPWGTVDSKGNWVNAGIDKFQFAEAKVNLSFLEGTTFDPCVASNRFTQIRTRASATDNSDLKDTTKIFNYSFSPPEEPGTTATGKCAQQFDYSTSATTADWTFTLSSTDYANGVRLSGGLSGTGPVYTKTGVKSGTVTVTGMTTEAYVDVTIGQSAAAAGGCTASGNGSIRVYRTLSVVASVSPMCGNKLSFSATASGGYHPSGYTYAWTFDKLTAGADPALASSWTSATPSSYDSGSASDASGIAVFGSAGTYRANVTAHDSADTGIGGSGKPQCTATDSKSTAIYANVGGSLTVTPDCDSTFSFSSTSSGGNGSYTYAWTLSKKVNGSYVTATTGTTSSESALDITDSTWAVNGEGTYKLDLTISDTQATPCTVTLHSGDFDVRNALTVTASKAADTGRTSVTLTATPSATTGVTYQWAKRISGVYTDITGATSASYSGYSTFETDATGVETDVVLGTSPNTDTYKSNVYTVYFRVTVSRTVNSSVCTNTAFVTVKKVVGVDP